MTRLVLSLALAILAACATPRVPELRVQWVSARSVRTSHGATEPTAVASWRSEAHARLVWPLAPPPPVRASLPRAPYAASALPQALTCVDARLCAWERGARRRAWTRHVSMARGRNR